VKIVVDGVSAGLVGLPVSTTPTRTAALLGVTVQDGGRTDLRVVRSIAAAWLLTFPGCGAIGFVMARVFLNLFQ
jgi:PiT family inorganic phosphate transporter